MNNWPHVSRNAWEIADLQPAPFLGWDWEWSIRTGTPTILGVSDGNRTVSVPHAEGFDYLRGLLDAKPSTILVGHNVMQADIQVASDLGWDIDVTKVEDTILRHWLLNPHLCKSSKKTEDGEGEKRGRGFMNLYSFCSLYTDAPNWKSCTEPEQCVAEERPCPEHDPWGYNGNDAYWPVIAIPKVLQLSKLRGVDKLYSLHRDVSLVLAKMTKEGLYVNRAYRDSVRQEFLEEQRKYWNKETKSGLLPFNPDSPKQVKEFFAAKGIELEDTTEDSINVALKEYDDPELKMLADAKLLGDGPDRWFADKVWNSEAREYEGYLDENDYIHPSFVFFTSSARLASSNPNCQNISVRRAEVGAKIRRCVQAPEGQLLFEADFSNAENRIYLHLAGYDVPFEMDIHRETRDSIGLRDDDPFAMKFQKSGKSAAREAVKSLSHAFDYFEGLSLITEADLRKANIQREISFGCRIVFRDWTFDDGTKRYIISFTGGNLADRAFGSRSWENRRTALQWQEKYSARWPKVRDLQRRIIKQMERERCVRPPDGYCTLSYGPAADRIKTALAIWGSQPIAHLTKLAMLNMSQQPLLSLRAQIHDALLGYADKRVEPKKVKAAVEECMIFEAPNIPGLRVPIEVSIGESWADQSKIK